MSGVSSVSRSQGAPIRVFSTTGVAVNGTSDAGWVSGTIASLAASGTATIIFDLGADWVFYPYVRIYFTALAPSSGLINTSVNSSATIGGTLLRQGFIDTDSVSTTYLTLASANGPQTADIRPMGRYIYISATNGDGANALGATSRIDLAQYPY